MRFLRATELFAACLLFTAAVVMFAQNTAASPAQPYVPPMDTAGVLSIKDNGLFPYTTSRGGPVLRSGPDASAGQGHPHGEFDGRSDAGRPVAYLHSRPSFDLAAFHSGSRARKEKKKTVMPFAGPPSPTAVALHTTESAVPGYRAFLEPSRTSKSIPGKRPDDPRASPGR